MSLFSKIAAISYAVMSFLLGVFFFLFRKEKNDNEEMKDLLKHQEEKINEQQKIIDFNDNEQDKKTEIENKHKEEIKKACTGNKLDNFNAMCNILQK